MNTEELTQVVTAHQSVIGRQSQSMAEHEIRMARIEAILESTAQQQAATARQQAINDQQIAINQEAIAQLHASILDLRNVVSDYIQSRNQID